MNDSNEKSFNEKSIEKQIREIHSRHCEPILEVIDAEDGITHGDLAEQTGLLPSGLSSVTKKMQTCSIPLITVVQAGKYRKYSLPEYVKQYFISKRQAGDDAAERYAQEDNLFLLLQRFVEAAGDNWREVMNYYLLEENPDYNSKTGSTFLSFMKQLEKKTNEQDECVRMVRSFIRNDVLLYLIDKFVEADL